MRSWTSTNQAPIDVWQDCEDILDPMHLDLSGFAMGQLERNSVPPYPVCEEKKCCDLATCDLSAQDCTDLTSGDQCKVVSTAGHGQGQHLDWHPASRERLRVPHRKSPKLFGGFVCRRQSPKCREPGL